MTTQTISADHIPATAKIINSTFGQVAIYGVETDATNYPVRYSAALLNSDGRIVDQTYGAVTEHGALTSIYHHQQAPKTSYANQIKAARDLGLTEAYISGVLTQIEGVR
jgi:hypothetical protein